MKKLVLLSFLFIFSNSFYAQETKAKKEPAKKETTKKKSGYDYDKDVTVKSTKKEATSKSTTTKETAKKETTKKKSGYDYDKKSNKSDVNKIDAKIKDEKYAKGNSSKKAPTLKESNEKAPKTPDKITGEYNGKKVYTGPRGGKYYINKNGNKTYIQD
jgi:colicin import membrane protein